MRTVDPRKLARAARELGEASLDPSAWPRLMDRICEAAGATGAALLQTDVRTPDIPRTASVDECFNHYFATGWQTRDTRAERSVPLLMRGQTVVTDQDIVTPEEMRRLDFYNECALPFGLPWFAGIGLRAGPALWAMVIQRTARQGPFEPHEVRVLATLSDRLTEVATLSTALGRVALAGATQALDRVGQAAIAIDRFGAVVDANGAAEGLLDDHLYIDQCRRLCAPDRKAGALLQSLFEQLRLAPDDLPIAALPIVVRRGGKGPVVIRVLPVPGAASSPFGGARVLLTLTAIEPKPGPDASVISDVFGLTRAESDIAALVAQGRSLAAIADTRGIARVTVRNQLRTIFAKTRTHRQSELVALLSRL